MNRTNIQEVKIIGQIQHAHLLATRITTRHFRKGVELDPIADDPYYDVKVQEVRPVNPPRTILPVSLEDKKIDLVIRPGPFNFSKASGFMTNTCPN